MVGGVRQDLHGGWPGGGCRITLGELPNEKEAASNEKPDNGSLDGLAVENLTPQIARQIELPANASGVVVTDSTQ